MTTRNVQQLVKKCAEEAKIKMNDNHTIDITPQMFRHTFAFTAAQFVDLYTLAHLLGHKDPRTTMIYM